MDSAKRQEVAVGSRRLVLSNLDKVLYPEVGTTKAAVIDYYTRVAPYLLPHLRGRPLTMKRYPDGVDTEPFFEKRCPSHAPDWVRTVRLGREGRADRPNAKVVDHCDVADVATLVWVANLASLELHSSLARGPDTSVPTCAVFDLDPGPPATVVECCRVALLLRDVFDRLGLAAWPKTSGGKGLQVYVPVNTPIDYASTRGFALAVGQLLERVHPELVLTTMTKAQRTGKVFVDWSQNHLTKTTVSVYSLRAQPTPTVSTPVTWDEVSDTATDATALSFEAADVIERVRQHGDLFAPVETTEQELPALAT